MKIDMFATICYVCLAFLSSIDVSIAIDSLNNLQSLTGNETLISPGNEFQLGFFDLGSSPKFYLGIWYNHIPTPTYVWIANRDNPLNDTSGVLRIGNDGNLVILDKTENTIWSTSVENISSRTTGVQLLDSGNLVLRDNKEGSVLWESSDHLSDAIVAEMKFGWDSRTGLNRNVTSWKSSDDPSRGEYTYGFDLHGLPQVVIWKGTSKWWRSGPWNGMDFGGIVISESVPFTFDAVMNSEEVYYKFSLKSNSSLVMNHMSHLGKAEFRSWEKSRNDWKGLLQFPQDVCGEYERCGPNSICIMRDAELKCNCLTGYTSNDTRGWSPSTWSGGCKREHPFNCSEEEFEEVSDVKLPDLLQFWLNTSLSLEECKGICLKNCSCTAYTNSNVTGPVHGCILWFGDLVDFRKLRESGKQKLYIRIKTSDREKKKRKEMIIIVVTVTASASILLLLAILFLIWKRKINQPGTRLGSQVTEKDNLELPCFNIDTVATATQNFLNLNKIGEGGYGPVYKGVLSNGQEIAVKRLSENSHQGIDECKNEIMLIAKLQHRNLVRLLGCCIQGEERMLIYEYMPNGSLDSYVYGGPNYGKKHLLVWRRRFSIIIGIARGLLYLHRDSRLRIIHRDLKASNVLLDSEMNPKISDFGMARAFGDDQLTTKTKRIVGTYGYMSPEYAIRGIFSMKSDVFSFGVLVLEIVSSQRNTRFHHPDHDFNLLGHAWNLWVEGKASELIDPLMEDSFAISEVLRCIQVGLLCVQQRPEDRPTMCSVLLMLDSETATLPQPKRPGFATEGRFYDETNCLSDGRLMTTNEVTNTMVEGR